MIRGEESVLQELEGEWSVVAMQMAWKLEPVYSYEENPTLDNSQVAGSDHSIIQPAENNVKVSNLIAPSNPNYSSVPLDDPITPAPLDTPSDTPP